MAKPTITVEQLASREDFQQWVLNPTDERNQHWKAWLLDHPQHQGTVAEARNLISLIRIESDPDPPRLKHQVWQQISANTEQRPPVRLWQNYRQRSYWVAASLLVLLAGFSLLYISFFQKVTHHTAYGETRTILLPDSSIVTLNANSTLRFAADWKEIEVREIWLEGEAFFEVRQIPLFHDSNTRLPFVVHSHHMDVEVLGTTFNVKDRESCSEVVLNTGKVTVTPRQAQKAAPIALLPGDWLAYSAAGQEWTLTEVNPEIPTSWRRQELILDAMRLEDIARLLEETYGYTILIETQEVKDYRFSGKIKTDEIAMLMPMLERSFGLDIQQEKNTFKLFKK